MGLLISRLSAKSPRGCGDQQSATARAVSVHAHAKPGRSRRLSGLMAFCSETASRIGGLESKWRSWHNRQKRWADPASEDVISDRPICAVAPLPRAVEPRLCDSIIFRTVPGWRECVSGHGDNVRGRVVERLHTSRRLAKVADSACFDPEITVCVVDALDLAPHTAIPIKRGTAERDQGLALGAGFAMIRSRQHDKADICPNNVHQNIHVQGPAVP